MSGLLAAGGAAAWSVSQSHDGGPRPRAPRTVAGSADVPTARMPLAGGATAGIALDGSPAQAAGVSAGAVAAGPTLVPAGTTASGTAGGSAGGSAAASTGGKGGPTAGGTVTGGAGSGGTSGAVSGGAATSPSGTGPSGTGPSGTGPSGTGGQGAPGSGGAEVAVPTVPTIPSHASLYREGTYTFTVPGTPGASKKACLSGEINRCKTVTVPALRPTTVTVSYTGNASADAPTFVLFRCQGGLGVKLAGVTPGTDVTVKAEGIEVTAHLSPNERSQSASLCDA